MANKRDDRVHQRHDKIERDYDDSEKKEEGLVAVRTKEISEQGKDEIVQHDAQHPGSNDQDLFEGSIAAICRA